MRAILLGSLAVAAVVALAGGAIWWAIDSAAKSREHTTNLLASGELMMAQMDAAEGKPVDHAKLAATPGMDAALTEAAENVKGTITRQLRDPTDPLWGDIWTPDGIVICGTVNGRNAFGAYAGDEVFYAPDGRIGLLPGHPDYKAKNLQMCFEGGHQVILPANQPA